VPVAAPATQRDGDFHIDAWPILQPGPCRVPHLRGHAVPDPLMPRTA